jgi:hypothetical protein
MTRYIKSIFGGLLAILAAFGWLSAILTLLAMKGIPLVLSLLAPKWIPLGVIVLLIFSVGFYLAFRAAYGSKSN